MKSPFESSPGKISGINAIGYFRGNHGLGGTARQTARLILNRKIPLALFNLDAKLEREERDSTLEALMCDSIEALPYEVNLFIGPLGDLPWLLLQYRELFLKSSRINVALSMWELTVVPETWKRALECFDVLLTPSDYMRYSFAANVPNTLVVSIGHPIDLSDERMFCRDRFALPCEKVLFFSSFDPWSDTVRKNPQGIIEAFRKGMGADDSAHLVIKLNNAVRGTVSHPEVQRLKNICADDARIHLIIESLSYAEVLNLYFSCDVFVSLHRAEGLGLALMESMGLAKPVIATAWSGNMTFMNHINSCLVGYDLVPVEGAIEYYRKKFLNGDAVWAEPHIDEAARWIRSLSHNSKLRLEIGKRAALDISRHNEKAEQALFLEEIVSIKENIVFNADVSRRRLALMQALNDSVYDHGHNRFERFGRDIRRLLDRHLLWRFREAS